MIAAIYINAMQSEAMLHAIGRLVNLALFVGCRGCQRVGAVIDRTAIRQSARVKVPVMEVPITSG